MKKTFRDGASAFAPELPGTMQPTFFPGANGMRALGGEILFKPPHPPRGLLERATEEWIRG